jgi:hypothetical protein
VVIIGETHWLRQARDFYIRLVRDREFQATVEDIVVEFAGRHNQALLDRISGGQEVAAEKMRRILAGHHQGGELAAVL